MKNFLDVHFFFNSTKNRTIHELASVYEQTKELLEALENITHNHLNSDNIKNKSILLKPNWVKENKRAEDEICLRTHNNFTLAALKLVLKLNPSNVVIGDAPIQRCRWDKMLSDKFIKEVGSLSYEFNIPVNIIDFRRRRFYVKQNHLVTDLIPLSDYVVFDIGKQSMLESITEPGHTKFRVTRYNPDRMNDTHMPGIHKYCIANELFKADLVISLPKIKTHQKTGITGALKNLVGLNGDKDFLPHHRIGGTGRGGDCYPGNSLLRYWAELALDEANRRQGLKTFWYWQKLSSLLWKISFPSPEHQLEAGWYGNDTTWRMVWDLNRIIEFGKHDGTIAATKRRQVYSLCDGITAGQGNGPLDPRPLPLGLISFTDNSSINDLVMATLMGFDPQKIPLVRQREVDLSNCSITLNGSYVQLDVFKDYIEKTQPPTGWMKHFNQAE